MNYSNKKIGFIQAVALATYVVIIAAFIQNVPALFGQAEPGPIIGITLFLLLFVVSALISSSIILGYPLTLLLDGEKQKAISIVIWSGVWLLTIFITVGAIVLLILNFAK